MRGRDALPRVRACAFRVMLTCCPGRAGARPYRAETPFCKQQRHHYQRDGPIARNVRVNSHSLILRPRTALDRLTPGVRNLFHLVQSLSLVEVFARDGNWSEQRYLLIRFLAFTEKCDQHLERSAYLAAGQLLDCGCHVAGFNLA